MIIVGELINTSRKEIEIIVNNRDKDSLQRIARAQVEAGADYLDVNCGTQAHDELATMEWLVNSIQEAVQVPLCVDSPDIGAVQVGLRLVRYGRPLINSVTAEQEVLRKVLPVIKEHEARIIALCMDEKGIPKTARDRFAVAERLVSDLTVLST